MELAYHELSHGITCIEAHYQRPNLACCYLLQEGDEAALIETGTAHTVPFIMELLQLKGIDRQQVKYVIPTHVHLDHAGGSGQLMQLLPEARLVVHPFGARHLINPEKLIAGTIGVYGEAAFARDYGTLIPVPASRVLEAPDGFTVKLGERKLLCLDTPGHARHHICVWDDKSRGFFTGDTFGNTYRELGTGRQRFIFPASTPIQFDPPTWQQSIKRLMSFQPEFIYLTHYCRVDDPAPLAIDLHRALDAYVELALNLDADPEHRFESLKSALWRYFRAELVKRGCSLPDEEIHQLLDMDVGLCAQGLEIWLERQLPAT